MYNRLVYYIAFLLIGLLSLVNRDLTPVNELKYISIALESLQSHHWFAFYNHGEIYADKPPIYFWIIIFGIKLFGIEYGIVWTGAFSLLSAVGICEVMYRWTKNQLSLSFQTAAILALLSNTLFLSSAIILRMDILMAFFITLSLYFFYQSYLRHIQGTNLGLLPHAMLLSVLVATLIKGPVGLFLPILVTITFLAQKKLLHSVNLFFPWKSVFFCLGILTLWLFAAYLEGGSQYLYSLTLGQAAKRGVHADVHAEPFYYYLEVAFSALLPWTLLCLVSLATMIKKKSFLNEEQRFFVTVVIIGLIMLSLISSKLEIYFLPLVPFLLYACSLQLPTLDKNHEWKWALIPISVLLLMLPIGPIFFEEALRKLPIQTIDLNILFSICFIVGLVSGYAILKSNIRLTINVIALGVFSILLTVALLIPKYNYLIGVKTLADAMQMEAAQSQGQYYAFQYSAAQNMDVYLNQDIHLINTEQQLLDLPKGSIVISKRRAEKIKKTFSEAEESFQSEINLGKYDIFVL